MRIGSVLMFDRAKLDAGFRTSLTDPHADREQLPSLASSSLAYALICSRSIENPATRICPDPIPLTSPDLNLQPAEMFRLLSPCLVLLTFCGRMRRPIAMARLMYDQHLGFGWTDR